MYWTSFKGSRIERRQCTSLAAAIYAGDLDTARKTLEEMAVIDIEWSEVVMAGKRLASPPEPLPQSDPWPLPVEGHLPGSTVANPRLSTGEAA